MKKNKLFYLYLSLSELELRKLGRQLHDPFFKTNEKMIALFQFLGQNKAKMEAADFEAVKKEAFDHLYPKESFASSKLRSVMAGLTERIQDFLIQIRFKKDKDRREAVLREIYAERNLDGFVFASIEQAQKKLMQGKQRDTGFYQQQLALSHVRYFYPDEQGYKDKNPYKNLAQLHDSLDAFYLLAKLQYSCEMTAMQKIRGIEYQIQFFELALKMGENARFAENQLVNLLTKLILALKNPSATVYFALKKETFENMDSFSREGQLHLLETLVNLSWFSVQGNKRSREIFDLYNRGMERQILLQNGAISPSNFFNVVDLGCALKEIDKVKKFMDKYANHLHTDAHTKENIVRLARAFLLFAEGKYEEISKVLIYLEYEDVSYGFRAHTLLIKSHYEVKRAKGYEEILKQCAAFKQYIARKYRQKYISKPIRDENMNFVKIMLKLPVAFDSKFATIKKDDLLEEVTKMEKLKGKDWLLEKIREI